MPHGIVLFDGTCAFCEGAVKFIATRDPDGYFKFGASQTPVAEQLLAQHQVSRESARSIILIEEGADLSALDRDAPHRPQAHLAMVDGGGVSLRAAAAARRRLPRRRRYPAPDRGEVERVRDTAARNPATDDLSSTDQELGRNL